MRSLFRKMHKGEKGFTLVELLVVFTLLALLAAIMIPSVSSLVDYGNVQAMAAEKSVIQTAMDSMMAVNGLASGDVTEVTSWVQNMATFPDADNALYPTFLRFATTKYYYECSTNGTVSADADGT